MNQISVPRPGFHETIAGLRSVLLVFTLLLASTSGCNTIGNLGSAKLTDASPKLDAQSLKQSQANMALAKAESAEAQGDLAEATRYYEEARQLDPQLSHLSRRLAVLYDLQGRDQAASDAYQAALSLSPNDAELLNDYGVYYLHRERWQSAETWLRRAVAAQPDHPRATTNLATALTMQGRLEEGFTSFESVVGPAAAYSNVGVLLVRQGRYDEGRHHFKQALQLDDSIRIADEFLAQLDGSEQDLRQTMVPNQDQRLR